MNTIIDALREIIGPADFYLTSGNYGSWDYGAIIEYLSAVLIICIVVSSIFRFLNKLVSR